MCGKEEVSLLWKSKSKQSRSKSEYNRSEQCVVFKRKRRDEHSGESSFSSISSTIDKKEWNKTRVSVERRGRHSGEKVEKGREANQSRALFCVWSKRWRDEHSKESVQIHWRKAVFLQHNREERLLYCVWTGKEEMNTVENHRRYTGENQFSSNTIEKKEQSNTIVLCLRK